MSQCQRCGNETNVTTGSWFNTEMICIPCSEKETTHRFFEAAKATEREAVIQGNYNFLGIGLPEDLK